jgi:3-methyladenine DNA glycosylase AlkD
MVPAEVATRCAAALEELRASPALRADDLRRTARRLGRDHELALALWDSGLPSARFVATMVDEPRRTTTAQLERWASDLDGWAIVDCLASELLRKTPFAAELVRAWAAREEEFVKRAAFALIAMLAVHDKAAPDRVFVDYLALVERASDDDRRFVKKAVNWALRQIGKRNLALNAAAIATAERVRVTGSRPGRWIAADALRELRGEPVQRRLRARASSRP